MTACTFLMLPGEWRRVIVITSSTSGTLARAEPSDRSREAMPPASPAPSADPVWSR